MTNNNNNLKKKLKNAFVPTEHEVAVATLKRSTKKGDKEAVLVAQLWSHAAPHITFCWQ